MKVIPIELEDHEYYALKVIKEYFDFTWKRLVIKSAINLSHTVDEIEEPGIIEILDEQCNILEKNRW